MAKDCLVTKLSGVVDNDNMPVFGKVRFSNKAGEGTLSGRLSIQGEGCTIEVSGGTFTVGSDTTPRTSYTIPDNNQKNFALSNDNIKGTISNKHDVVILSAGTAGTPSQNTNIKIDVADLSYCSDLQEIIWFKLSADNAIDLEGVESLANIGVWDCILSGGFKNMPVSLSSIDIRRSRVGLKTDDFVSLTNLTSVVTSSSDIEGDIENFGNLKMVSSFMCDNCSGLNGELADLITALATNRPVGAPASVMFQFVNTQCTYNGSAITGAVTINF